MSRDLTAINNLTEQSQIYITLYLTCASICDSLRASLFGCVSCASFWVTYYIKYALSSHFSTPNWIFHSNLCFENPFWQFFCIFFDKCANFQLNPEWIQYVKETVFQCIWVCRKCVFKGVIKWVRKSLFQCLWVKKFRRLKHFRRQKRDQGALARQTYPLRVSCFFSGSFSHRDRFSFSKLILMGRERFKTHEARGVLVLFPL